VRKPLKILHILSQRPDATGSGVCLQAMMREAAARGHRNFLVAGVRSGDATRVECADPEHCRFVKFSGEDMACDIVGMSDVMPYDSTRFCDLNPADVERYEAAFTRVLTAAVERFRPDIIHSHHLWLVSSLARRLFPRIPMVTACHGSDLRQFQNCSHLCRRVLSGCRRIDAVMALSQVQKEEITQLYGFPPKRVFVTGAGYNDTLFTSAAKPDPDPVQIVYAGKLCNAKGVPWLLRALGRIDAPAWHLHLLGDGSGPERDACLTLAEALAGRATVYGAVPQNLLAERMRRAHVFVLPSFFEGLPLVVLEALASGCRIVVTDLPGVSELLGEIRSDAIHLVETPGLHHLDQPFAEDEAAFEAALETALRSQLKAARRQPRPDPAAFEQTLRDYTWSGIFDRVLQVYDSALTSTRERKHYKEIVS